MLRLRAGDFNQKIYFGNVIFFWKSVIFLRLNFQTNIIFYATIKDLYENKGGKKGNFGDTSSEQYNAYDTRIWQMSKYDFFFSHYYRI